MTDINQRFKEVRKAASLSQAELADIIGVSPAHISMIESGKSRPSKQLIKAVCSHFSVSEDWFLYGNSPMVLPEKQLTSEQIEEIDRIYQEIQFKTLLAKYEMWDTFLSRILKWLKETELNIPSDPLLGKTYHIKLDKTKKELIKKTKKILKLLNDSSK